MQRSELLTIVEGARKDLSKQRGYDVSLDSPVCIHIAERMAATTGLVVKKIPVPEVQDFEAVVVGDIDGSFCLVDPVHRVWAKKKEDTPPDVQQAVLVLPIRSNLNVHREIPYWRELNPDYLRALSRFIQKTARVHNL